MKMMYVGLENILVLVSAFNNADTPKPGFSFKTDKNKMRYVYVRENISEISNIEFGVVSELSQNELTQVVEFLNKKYGLRIIYEIANNGESITDNTSIIYADYIDVQGNSNYRARVENLKIKQE